MATTLDLAKFMAERFMKWEPVFKDFWGYLIEKCQNEKLLPQDAIAIAILTAFRTHAGTRTNIPIDQVRIQFERIVKIVVGIDAGFIESHHDAHRAEHGKVKIYDTDQGEIDNHCYAVPRTMNQVVQAGWDWVEKYLEENQQIHMVNVTTGGIVGLTTDFEWR